MPSNYTPNYNLNQWEPDDRVLRTDFNADNAKIDAALNDLNRLTELLAYYTGQIGSLIRVEHGNAPRFAARGFIWDPFNAPEGSVLTGGAVIQNGILSMSGAGTGTAKFNMYINALGWTHGWFWLHVSDGTAVPSIDSAVLAKPTTAYVENYNGSGKSAKEYCYAFTSENGKPVTLRSVPIQLDLTSTQQGIKVHDFSAVFI